jgi:Sel1 repeat
MRVNGRIVGMMAMAAALGGCGAAPGTPESSSAATSAAAAAGGADCTTAAECLADAHTAGEEPKVAEASLIKACDLGSGPACTEAGARAHKATPPNHAHALMFSDKACTLGEAEGCINLGFVYTNGWGVAPDPAKAAAALSKACDLGKPNGCEDAGVIYYQGQGGVPADFDKAHALFEKACAGKNTKGCFNLAVTQLKAQGTKQDVPAALVNLKKACDAGDEAGCKTAKAVQEQIDKSTAAGGGDKAAAGGGDKATTAPGSGGKTQLTVGSISADGFTVNDLACELTSVGLMATVEIVAGLGKKKSDLDACAPAGDAPRVSWTFDGSKIAQAKAEKVSSPKVGACVEKALNGLPTTMQGSCIATLVIGKSKGDKK